MGQKNARIMYLLGPVSVKNPAPVHWSAVGYNSVSHHQSWDMICHQFVQDSVGHWWAHSRYSRYCTPTMMEVR